MNYTPTARKRNVVIALNIRKQRSGQGIPVSGNIESIFRICALFADHHRITEGVYKDPDEAVLLSRFWRALQPNDRIFGSKIVPAMAFLRKRSWHLGVIPSADIALSQVYRHELVDTQRIFCTPEAAAGWWRPTPEQGGADLPNYRPF